ncbi:hypothetical protein [Arthrobacter sp. SLBN-122]|uniref:hypothetical protein n=1 Tax=Arthrobacter sp. SLBN-122 TaxID=2768455 RepID=UPI00114E7D46|nr:hypothetical protein [Arthrobacter sp. SLBN-122]TQJ33385.1 hypothetical protein FBY36_0595 [Arthrobacter sp. SLBN-122]
MARRSRRVPQEPGYVPYRPPEKRTLHRLSETGEIVAYTDEEYGVRKDDGLGIVKPVNSSGGLLFLSLLMTAMFGLMLYGIVQMAVTDQWDILGRTWWMYLLVLYPLFAGWAGFFKERKAEKLRRSKNLPPPVE